VIAASDYRHGWTVSGQYVATIKAHEPVDELVMLTYYGANIGGEHYSKLAAPAKYPRIVLLKQNGSFVIVPINPDVIISEIA
jgi:hypothetical protein